MFQAIRSRQSKKKKNWYGREGQFDSVIFVEPTPNSCFKKEVQQAAKESKLKIRVVERVSTTVKKLLQKSNPFEKEICGRDDCEMCRQGCKDDCRTRRCVYEVKCKDCDRKYRGTTGRTAITELVSMLKIGQEERAVLCGNTLGNTTMGECMNMK